MDLRLSAEVAGAELGDARLAKRYEALVDRIAERPEASLPKVLTVAELESAYRFVNNQRVTLPGLLDPHIRQTVQRCASREDVVVAHDTTELKYTGEEREGLGRLRSTGRGFYLHLALAIGGSQGRDPLGIVAARTLVRGEKRAKERPTIRRRAADKESRRWWEQVREVESRLGVGRAVHVADREADAYEFMAEVSGCGGRFVVRVRHDRRVETGSGPANLGTALQLARVVAEREVELSPRKLATAPIARRIHPPRKARTAKLEISAARVQFLRPKESPVDWPATLAFNVVNVVEVDTPSGCDPVTWTLVTTELIETPEQILAVVDAYRARWVVEEYFKALKTGCAIEKRQNESLHALLNVLGLYIPVAWQMLRLRLLARSDDTLPADRVMTDAQIQILRAHPRTRNLIGPNPTTRTALLAIAALGGHLKQNGEPGWQTIGRGFHDLLLLEDGWLLNSPECDR
jgi:hypothetical protein